MNTPETMLVTGEHTLGYIEYDMIQYDILVNVEAKLRSMKGCRIGLLYNIILQTYFVFQMKF